MRRYPKLVSAVCLSVSLLIVAFCWPSIEAIRPAQAQTEITAARCAEGTSCSVQNGAPPGCMFTPCCTAGQQTGYCNALYATPHPRKRFVQAPPEGGICAAHTGPPITTCETWNCLGNDCPNCWLDEDSYDVITSVSWKTFGPCKALVVP